MPVLSGNTSGSITSVAYNIPSEIISYSLVNRAGGSITVNVAIVTGSGTYIYVYSGSIATNESVQSDKIIKVKAGYQILIITSGSLDYYFSIK